MSGYLIDTSVISEIAPGRVPLSMEVAGWLRRHSRDLFLSVISVAEIEEGIAKLEVSGASRRAAAYTAWLQGLTGRFGPNIVTVDADLALAIGRMSALAHARGRHPGFADVAIAATARARGLVLLTRNVKHFAPLGIETVDPLVELPS